MIKCSACGVGQFAFDKNDNMFCTHCGYVVPKCITTLAYRNKLKRENELMVLNGKKCPFCKKEKPLTSHHIIPKRTELKTKEVLCCRTCHNIADMIVDILYPKEFIKP